ncbi:MAG: flagellar protein FlaG [Paenibacillaceae bacterium]
MSSNMSVSSSVTSNNVEKVQVVTAPEPVKMRSSQTADTPNPAPISPNTTRELKNAEIQGKKIPLGEEQIIKAIERANKALQGKTTTFEFSVHEKTKQIMVKVMDEETGEVIREIPPEKVLDMVARLWEMAGIIVDEHR